MIVGIIVPLLGTMRAGIIVGVIVGTMGIVVDVTVKR